MPLSISAGIDSDLLRGRGAREMEFFAGVANVKTQHAEVIFQWEYKFMRLSQDEYGHTET